MKSTLRVNCESDNWEHLASLKAGVKDFVLSATVGSILSLNIEKKNLNLPLDEENILKFYEGTLNLTKLEESLLARISVSYSAETRCARCLDEYKREGKINFEEEYFLDRKKLSFETRVVDKNFEIEVGEPIYEEIYFNIPMKPLCSEDCEGVKGQE